VGLLFFNEAPERFFPATQIDVVWFPDGAGGDRSIRMEDLRRRKAVSRRYRNRRIGEFLKELELTEGRSTGIPEMLRVMAENGSPAPEFETDEDRTHYLVRLPVHANADWQELAIDPVSDPVVRPTPQVTPQVKRLIAALNGEMTRAELMQVLDMKDRKNFGLNYIVPALEACCIEPTNPNSPNSPTQKYRLTVRGQELLKTL
jgi:Predicted transcriptional regulator containing an HTH domain and an uncharacterized domain shared with the mammalian protein Schlafen